MDAVQITLQYEYILLSSSGPREDHRNSVFPKASIRSQVFWACLLSVSNFRANGSRHRIRLSCSIICPTFHPINLTIITTEGWYSHSYAKLQRMGVRTLEQLARVWTMESCHEQVSYQNFFLRVLLLINLGLTVVVLRRSWICQCCWYYIWFITFATSSRVSLSKNLRDVAF